MARHMLNLQNGTDTRLWPGDEFTWRGDRYRLDKLAQVNAQITSVAGSNHNLDIAEIERSATKCTDGENFVKGKSWHTKKKEARERTAEANGFSVLKVGMAVSYSRQPGKLWVIVKMQPKTGRADIVRLGGAPNGADREWRCPVGNLTPIDAINNFQGVSSE